MTILRTLTQRISPARSLLARQQGRERFPGTALPCGLPAAMGICIASLCLFASPFAIVAQSNNTSAAPVAESFQSAVQQLGSPHFQIRTKAANQLQQEGFAAADFLLVANSKSDDLEQRLNLARLLQQLPSLHHLIRSLAPDVDSEALLKLRHFHTQPFPEKVAALRLLQRYPEAETRQLIMYCVARFDPNPLIRQFAAATFLEDRFPIDAAQFYAQKPSTAAADTSLLTQVPDRPDSTESLATLSVKQWMTGQAQLIPGTAQDYQLLSDPSPRQLVQEASWLQESLLADQNRDYVPPRRLIDQLVMLGTASVQYPVVAQTPLEFHVRSETTLKLLRWAITQTHLRPTFEDAHHTLLSCWTQLGKDPEIFAAQSVHFCDFACELERFDLVCQWHDHAVMLQDSTTPPPSVLSLADAAFKLGKNEQADLWLQQDVLSNASRHVAVQYAMLAQELGYSQCQHSLLEQTARLPIDGQVSSVWAKILYAENLAARCETAEAAKQLSWLLVLLDQDVGLRHKTDKLLPQGLDALRARYHYFAATEACNHWDWNAALQHLSLGHLLAPYDTNLLKLGWEVNMMYRPAQVNFRWDAMSDRDLFLAHQLTSSHSEQHTISQNVEERFSDFPIAVGNRQLIAQQQELEQMSQFAGTMVSTMQLAQVDVPLLSGDYLTQQTRNALEHFDQQIRSHELQLQGSENPSLRQVAHHQLTKSLNRWAYLAASTGQQSELAYNRASRAATMAQHSAYYDTLSICAQKTGRIAEAIQATRMAVSLSPHDSQLRTRLADLQTVAQLDLR